MQSKTLTVNGCVVTDGWGRPVTITTGGTLSSSPRQEGKTMVRDDIADAARYSWNPLHAPIKFDNAMYWITNGGTVMYSSDPAKKEAPMKLPSLKTAAANYKKAVKTAAKADKTLNSAVQEATIANIRQRAAAQTRDEAQRARDAAKSILLQVAGK